MDEPVLQNALRRMLSQLDLRGMKNVTTRAQTIANTLGRIGLNCQVVKREVHHHYIGNDWAGKVGTRRFHEEYTPVPLVQMGTHLIDPLMGLTTSARALESIHSEAFERLGKEEMYLSSAWRKYWENHTDSITGGDFLQVDEADQKTLITAGRMTPEQAWEAQINDLVAKSVGLGVGGHVGYCLAVLAGAASHLIVYELCPAQTHRILAVEKWGDRKRLVQRGVQMATNDIHTPLFKTMNLPSGGSECFQSWLPSYDAHRSNRVKEIPGEEGLALLPMNSTQRWSLERHETTQVEAFMELTRLMTQRHDQLFGVRSTRRPRTRM